MSRASTTPTANNQLGRWGLGDRDFVENPMKARLTVEVSIDVQWLVYALLVVLVL